ncbi:type IV pilus secretin PilQ [Chromohalobacter canadensis]|uniref:type IV pilus secretin PilQ n=1 Tax=Chromohalobacter canadensis TaxID=141389 RepID=UPI0021C042F9|nr:type IV pilus secretin PilQ [Chromohalobacter canadensis]MCT8467122.1 type IV pilus secretin PilQ [Chromohalobacter canadensis]MCT8471130.1 type IV pilus secretin PilQ [Chromohalobacter canadensis]MCT8497619.1 type IV pilus secretin PilQ [Chromohalobacter canadensis]
MMRTLREWLMSGLCFVGLVVCAQGQAATLTSLEFAQRGDGGIDALLAFDGPAPEPQSYRSDSPAQIVVDLPETTNQLEQRRFGIDRDGLREVSVAETGERTRLVFGLDEPLPYSTQRQGQRLRVHLGGDAAERSTALTRIRDLDFRRGDNGGGRLVVTLDRGGVTPDTDTEGNTLTVTLPGVRLPEELNSILDVSDFDTPVSRIVPQGGDEDVTLSFDNREAFQHLVTQRGDQLIVEVQPRDDDARASEGDTQEYDGEPVSLNFQNIQVREVLSVLSDFSGVNIVASDSVQGSVTLNLTQVPWDQALDLILKSHGLASRREGDVIVVAPADELAQMERQTLENRAQSQQLAPLKTEYVQVRYAKATDLATMLRGSEGFGLLSERGRVTVDERTNTLLVRDTPEQLAGIRGMLDKLDVPVRQVQIEARIVIARDTASQELGVNWGVSQSQGVTFDEDGVGSVVDRNPSGANRGSAGLSVDLGDGDGSGSAFSFGYLSGDVLLDLELNALESEGKSQTISQPKIITANQKKAVIKQGQEIPYQESTSSGATNVEFKEAVLSLAVTPQITPDDSIVMDLLINNDTVADSSYDGAPAIDTNSIETQVLVNDGETVVLGGILTSEQLRNLSKTPLLGDLPFIGSLFRYTQESNEKVELLIFITPKIIGDEQANR